MRFIIDQCLSPLVAEELSRHGHSAVHVLNLGLHEAEDSVVLAAAREQSRIVITADHDYPMLLAISGHASPSVILLKEDAPAAALQIVALLLRNLAQLQEPLAQGCIAIVHADRIRLRRLPIR